jgi:hypothetical protein
MRREIRVCIGAPALRVSAADVLLLALKASTQYPCGFSGIFAPKSAWILRIHFADLS